MDPRIDELNDAKTSASLFELMTDYLRHLELHLDQIADTLAAFRGQ